MKPSTVYADILRTFIYAIKSIY